MGVLSVYSDLILEVKRSYKCFNILRAHWTLVRRSELKFQVAMLNQPKFIQCMYLIAYSKVVHIARISNVHCEGAIR